MKRVYDVTGTVQNVMWNYDPPYPHVNIKPLPEVPWAGVKVYAEIFEGMHSQTGTYLETPAHVFGGDHPLNYPLIDVPVEKLVDVPCVLLNLPLVKKGGLRHAITAESLTACEGASDIQEGDALIIGTGWGQYWMDPDYVTHGPYFTKAAMDWLLAKKPVIIGGDSPRWENMEEPQGFFPDFYGANVLMLAPLVNLENVPFTRCRLTVLPLKVNSTCCAPARAVLTGP